MPLVIDIAVAKTNKYASRESGDTVEIVERPGGGLSVIMADGQGSGRAAKTLSLLVTAKVAALLKEGVRDSASARASTSTGGTSTRSSDGWRERASARSTALARRRARSPRCAARAG